MKPCRARSRIGLSKPVLARTGSVRSTRVIWGMSFSKSSSNPGDSSLVRRVCLKAMKIWPSSLHFSVSTSSLNPNGSITITGRRIPMEWLTLWIKRFLHLTEDKLYGAKDGGTAWHVLWRGKESEYMSKSDTRVLESDSCHRVTVRVDHSLGCLRSGKVIFLNIYRYSTYETNMRGCGHDEGNREHGVPATEKWSQ